MKFTKNQLKYLKIYFFNLFFFIALLFLIGTSNQQKSMVVNNINTVKSVQSSRIEQIIEKTNQETIDEIIDVFSIQDLNNYKGRKLKFTGTLTAYGPDCVGCSGKIACSPYQDVRDGNIFYNDLVYGKLRILAADKSIPCGSIIKISNYEKINDSFYGIVLDRGSDIQGLTMDLLYESEREIFSFGRFRNIHFEMERWGF